MGIDDVADELYALAPGAFTATRNTRAAQAREGGDRQLAAAIASLRRPTVGAWAVNQLSRHRAHRLTGLLDLGPALRSAQDELAGEAIRRLSRQRQEAVRTLVDDARSIAEEAGERLTRAGQAEVEGVLERALADPELAEAVRLGRLTTATGQAAVSGFESGASTAPRARRARSSDSETGTRRSTRARQGQPGEAERRTTRDARRARGRAEKALERVRARIAQAEGHLAALRAEERAANDELRQARRAERAAPGAQTRAEGAPPAPRG